MMDRPDMIVEKSDAGFIFLSLRIYITKRRIIERRQKSNKSMEDCVDVRSVRRREKKWYEPVGTRKG